MAGYTMTNRQDDHKTHLHEAVPKHSTGTLQRKPEAGRPVCPRPPCVSPAALAIRCKPELTFQVWGELAHLSPSCQ